MIKMPTCVLDALRARDAEALARHANDREVWINLRDLFPHPYSKQNAVEYIAHVSKQKPRLSFGILVAGEAIGSITVKPGSDVERVSAEIGYFIGREYWGRGIMTDAVRAITGYGFGTLGVERIFAVPFSGNFASVRVLEKAGFVKEGTMRRSAIKDGRVLDQLLYAAYSDTWMR